LNLECDSSVRTDALLFEAATQSQARQPDCVRELVRGGSKLLRPLQINRHLDPHHDGHVKPGRAVVRTARVCVRVFTSKRGSVPNSVVTVQLAMATTRFLLLFLHVLCVGSHQSPTVQLDDILIAVSDACMHELRASVATPFPPAPTLRATQHSNYARHHPLFDRL
jgi:hypothetical protein